MRQYSTNEMTPAGQRRITVVGVDLGKTWIEVCGQDASGKVRLTGKRRPAQFKTLMAQLPACLVGLEACGRSHHWARVLQGYGHEVKLMAPQFVKPYVQSNKSDRADAQAVCEAVQRPTMRFVGVKTAAQQDQQSLHRIRSLAVAQRTALVNQVRGLLAEQGIEIGQGRARVRAALPGILEEGENGLSGEFRELVQDAYETLVRMDARLDELEARIARWAKADEQVQRLLGIPGIGPITAPALLAAVGDVGTFRNGRELAAWLGLVPRQHSTGGVRAVIGYQQTGGCLRARLTDTRRPCGAAGVGQEDGPAQPLGTGCRGPATSECGGGGVGQPHGAHRLCVVGQRGGLPGRPRAANGLSGGQYDEMDKTTDSGG